MVIGYDSYSDSSQRGKSVGSAVFSINPQMTRWFSQCALHGDGEQKELVGNLARFCQSMLHFIFFLYQNAKLVETKSGFCYLFVTFFMIFNKNSDFSSTVYVIFNVILLQSVWEDVTYMVIATIYGK